MEITAATILLPVAIVSAIGLICGLALSIASLLFSVAEDETVTAIRKLLPGANCGVCGRAGCDDFARAVSEGLAEPNACIPGGRAVREGIGRILGTDVQAGLHRLAIVSCFGTDAVTEKRYEYRGLSSCHAANLLHAGGQACRFGCIGLGDCLSACPFGAISLQDGVAVIDRRLCTGCGICVKTCPKALIVMIPDKDIAFVTCANKSKGAFALTVCKQSCIACRRCVKACAPGAITVKNNLAVINTAVCTNCGACVAVCPRNAISLVAHRHEPSADVTKPLRDGVCAQSHA